MVRLFGRAILYCGAVALFLAMVAVVGQADRAAPSVSVARDADMPVGADGVIGTEDRKLLSEFTLDGVADQAAMRASLAATQRLSCRDGTAGSASLIWRADVIIFSAHQLLTLDGKKFHEFDDCVFVVTRNGKTEAYPLLLTTLDHGKPPSPDEPDDAWNRGNQNDWSVVRLDRPVPGIEPYRLPEQSEVGRPGSAVTTVSDSTDNWQGENGMLAQNCHVIEVEGRVAARFPAVMRMDCDVGRGASGSAILQDVASGAPRYIGTTIAYTGNDCRQAGLTTCFSIGRRLDPDLVARIQGTSALRATPQEQALGAAQDARLAGGRKVAATRAMQAVSAALPAQDDPPGRRTAALYAQIKQLVADGHPDRTDALFLEIYRLLHDPDQTRPEWPLLLLQNGESLLRQQRPVDAFQCFHAALAVAPDALKPYLQLRIAQTATDQKVRKESLRGAYLAAGDGLFQSANADAELADVKANGLTTKDE
jgi:hypothetical protein